VRRHLHQGHIDAIRSILGGRNGAVLSSSIQNASFKALTAVPHPDDGAMDDLEAYTSDWTRLYSGGTCVCFPSDTTEVSRVLKYCNEQQIGVVPQGGNTGLVGGAVARNPHELIVSLRRMNRIIEIDVDSAVLYCEAGCVLESLMQALEPHGLIVPLDLGAKGSCQIGGNVSTNAGGLRVVRYGSMQANVLGLEVVLADGTIIDMLRGLRKDNCGYHLRHLFVGAEGSLGVVTKVAMQLFPKPKNTMAILFKVRRRSALIILCD
jgi:D-2-hydroxyglutarate dehydrogenase